MNKALAPLKAKAPAHGRGRGQRRYLSEAIQLEEDSVPVNVRLFLAAMVATILLFVGWASITTVEEVAIAPGALVPSGAVQVVQHLEGGMVSEILARDGQLVEQGEVLMRLAPAQARSEAEQLEARLRGLQVRAERLKAFAEGREPDFSAVAPQHSELVADQRRIYENQIQNRDLGGEVVQKQIEQKRAEVTQMEDALAIAQRHLKLTAELVAMREGLVAKGLISRVEFLETRRAQVTAQGEVLRLEQQIRTAREALSEVENRQQNLYSTMRQEALNEMGTVTSELSQVQEAMKKASDRVERLDVRAPVRGLVQDLRVRTVGSVIQPGAVLMRVVPADDRLEVEVRIAPRDIAHVRPGQRVTIKAASYDFARYGGIPGILERVSASTALDDEAQPHYKGVVRPARNHVGVDPGQHPLLPGMTATVDIVTGEKTLLEYLLKPVAVGLQQSFRER